MEKVLHFSAKDINLEYLQSDEYRADGSALRGSVMVLGPLLARFGSVCLPKPGGDKIGRRRLDTHFLGFQNLEQNLFSTLKTIFIHLAEKN